MNSIFVLLVWAWILAVVGLNVSGWFQSGYVEVGPAGQALALTGAPGDEIYVKLRLPEGADLDEQELSVSLHDEESPFTAVLRLQLEAHDEDDDGELDEFYVRMVVPGVPEKVHATLAGVLGGSYTLEEFGRENFQVPLTLQVVRDGEAPPSGYKDMRWQHALDVAGVVLFLTSMTGIIALVVWAQATQRREIQS